MYAMMHLLAIHHADSERSDSVLEANFPPS